MIQIRKNTFETNSSSTHSMVIGKVSDFDKWKAGELFYVEYVWGDAKKYFTRGAGFYTKDEVSSYAQAELDHFSGTFNKDDIEILREYEIYAYNAYFEYKNEYLESDEHTYTTDSGEVLKIVCHYGHD